jgi:hypothetical protein
LKDWDREAAEFARQTIVRLNNKFCHPNSINQRFEIDEPVFRKADRRAPPWAPPYLIVFVPNKPYTAGSLEGE